MYKIKNIHSRTIKTTLSELGKGTISVDVVVDYAWYDGIRKTYDSPAEPAHAELDGVKSLAVVGADYVVTRGERPDWFAWLDAWLTEFLCGENLTRLVMDREMGW